MTLDEIKRYEKYQELKTKQLEYLDFLESIEINDEHKLKSIAIRIEDRGIAPSIERYDIPSEFTEDAYNYLIGFITSQIESLNLKIKAL